MIFAEDGPTHFLFAGKPCTLEEGQVALFWAVVPHLATRTENAGKLWWVKVPTRQFFAWNLPEEIVQALLQSRFIRDPRPRPADLQLAQGTAMGIVLKKWERRSSGYRSP